MPQTMTLISIETVIVISYLEVWSLLIKMVVLMLFGYILQTITVYLFFFSTNYYSNKQM